MTEYNARPFDLSGFVAVVTGASGVLGSAMATGLAAAGARVCVLARGKDRAQAVVDTIERASGEALAVAADVLQRADLERARDDILAHWGRIDVLVNAAGGNVPGATVNTTNTVFDVTPESWRAVIDLNLTGTILPCQIFGQVMARANAGSIVTISSMAADRALTRVGGYGAAKAGVESFTRWLATELARNYGPGLRVNAIAPGFFIGEQNRSLLLQPDGSPTERGATIIAHTPAGRFGEPDDLLSTLLWLCSPASSFVTGVVVPVDGGFSAFSGV